MKWLCKDVANMIKHCADPNTYFKLLITAKIFQPEDPNQRKRQLNRLFKRSQTLYDRYRSDCCINPMPVFTRYMIATRQTIKNEFPNAKGHRITKEIAKRWHALPEHEKRVYKDAYNFDIKRQERQIQYIQDWPRLHNKIQLARQKLLPFSTKVSLMTEINWRV